MILIVISGLYIYIFCVSVDFSVQVLSSGSWPFQQSCTFSLPQEVRSRTNMIYRISGRQILRFSSKLMEFCLKYLIFTILSFNQNEILAD